MAIYLYHGDDHATSRADYLRQLEREKSGGSQILPMDGSSLIGTELESILNTANLFQSETLAIENIFSRLKSKERDRCLALIAGYRGAKNIILWEKKEITKSQLKPFPSLVQKLSKLPMVIFQLLDSLSPGNLSTCRALLKQTSKVADEGFVFIMVARRVGELLIAHSGDTNKLSPWQKSKLVSQAHAWSESLLLSFHHRLHRFDYELKTGRTKLSYLDILDITFSDLIS